MQIVYLTRRNLLALLSKLDRVKAGKVSLCTLIKQDTVHPKYPCSTAIMVAAVEDEDYYTDRPAGVLHPKDEPVCSACAACGGCRKDHVHCRKCGCAE